MARLGWMLAVLTIGCGRQGFDDIDGGGPASGPVTVTVYNNGTPARVDVLFHDAQGTLVAIVPTSFEGVAVHDLSPGGMVTAVWEFESYFLDSIAGVEPGDDLVIGSPTNLETFVGDVTLRLVGPAAGAAYYAVAQNCSFDVLPNATSMLSSGYVRGCAPQDRGAALAIAFDGNDAWVASGYSVDIPLQPNQTAQVTTSAWQTTWEILSVDIRNPPSAAAGLRAFTEELRDGIGFGGSEVIRNSGAPAVVTLQRPKDFANGLGLAVWARVASGATGVYRRTLDAPATVTMPVDLSGALPSLVTAVMIGDTQGRPQARFDATGDLTDVDGGQLGISWTVGTTVTQWHLIVPPGMLEFRVPELPDFPGLRPIGANLGQPSAAFFDADFLSDFDELRTRYAWLILQSELPPTSELWATEINNGLTPLFPN